MLNINLKNNFEIRNVEEKHLEQYNNLMNYVFQITNENVNEIGAENLEKKKKHILKFGDTIGWFDKDKLVSNITTIPYHVNIHGKEYKMAGVTGVGTYPEYAGHGLIHSLMKKSLERMKEKGQTISYLYPYSIPYYRKKGWEIISDLITYKLKDTQLPEAYKVSGHVAREEIGHIDEKKVYELFSLKTNGAMIRNDLAWEEHLIWEREGLMLGIYYDAQEKPTGYVLYKILEDVFYVQEMITLNEEARKGIWNFIGAHFSMINEVKGNIFTNEPIGFLLDDGRVEQKIVPYYMARIVDVKGFFEQFPFNSNKNTEIVFNVTDPMVQWNCGTFMLSFDESGKVKVSTESRKEGIYIDIPTLTTMMLSYKRPTELKRIERISASEEDIKLLEKIIPNEKTWFSDYF